MGAERDRIVDEEGVKEMATFLDTEHIMLPTVPHEVGWCYTVGWLACRCFGRFRRGNFQADVAINSTLSLRTEGVTESLMFLPEPP